MRINIVLALLGKLCIGIGIAMLLPLACSVYYNDGSFAGILESMIVAIILGVILLLSNKSKVEHNDFRQREGYLFATSAWLIAGFIGALPYFFTGVCPNIIEAFFESMSGFTTTGASIFSDIESLPQGILMWRSLTQWIGGMGIVVLLLAVLFGGNSSAGGTQMYKAEAPGNSLSERLTPKISTTSKILWTTYLFLSATLVVLLSLGGMSLFDAVNHTFTTMSTGGFSTKNTSIAYFDSAYIQWVITIFMILAGCNFAYFYMLVVKKENIFKKSIEFKSYILVILGVTLVMSISLLANGTYAGESIGYVIRTAAFQTATIITTTGFATADFNIWPSLCQIILFSLFFVGACSGSTSGSVKIVRIIAIIKNSFAELGRLVHPKAVTGVKLNNKLIPNSLLINTLQFFCIYIGIFFISSLVMAATGLGFTEAITAAASCIGNIGPGFGELGPMYNYADVSNFGKLYLSGLMLVGRLEIYTVLVLLVPGVWKK